MHSNDIGPISVRIADKLRRKLGYGFPRLGSLAYRLFFKALPRNIDVELLPGIRAQLNTNDGTQRATYWLGSRFEHPTPLILKKWAAEHNAIFFDIGSNYGWFSLYLASELPRLEIYAFEPNPPTFKHLKGIVDRNGLQKIHTFNIGLGDQTMTSQLRIGIEDSGHSTLGPHPELSGSDAIEISVQPFDIWRREAGLQLPITPSWLAKIDVEGFECRVITGMQEALQAKAFRGLAIEVNHYTLGFCGDNAEKLITLLGSFGYVERTPDSPDECCQMNKFFVPRA